MDEHRREILEAIRLFDYDPVQSPPLALESARCDVERAEKALKVCQNALNELDDDSVYEFSPWSQGLSLQPCEIDDTDPQTIRLSNATHDSAAVILNREQLEKGESITWQHWKHFALGHGLRNLLQEQVQKAEDKLQHQLDEVDRIQSAIDNGEVALTESDMQDLRFLSEMDEMEQRSSRGPVAKHDWRIEGF